MSADFSSEVIPLWTVLVGALAGLAGWAFSYWHKQHTDIKANKLERINRQLRELYGPLYARLMAGDSVWNAFKQNHWPAHGQSSYFAIGAEVTDQEKAVWRNWMANVFEPFNAETEKLILSNIDLLDDDEVPAAFIDALAHIAAYKSVLSSWRDHDYSIHVSVNNWPDEALLSIVAPEYKRLKKLQRELIGLN